MQNFEYIQSSEQSFYYFDNIPDASIGDWIIAYNGDVVVGTKKWEGDITDIKGNILGKHEGIINFTIGQRKGIKISHQEPLYVVDIDSKKNKVIVGSKEALLIKKIYLKDINLLSNNDDYKDILFIKVRSTGRLIKARVDIKGSNAEVDLLENEAGISPGQACVFYKKNKSGDKVLGGGWIDRTVNKYLST